MQVQRIGHNRPLLPLNNFSDFLDALHHERDFFYEQVASLTLNSDDNDLEKHIAMVINAIKKQKIIWTILILLLHHAKKT